MVNIIIIFYFYYYDAITKTNEEKKTKKVLRLWQTRWKEEDRNTSNRKKREEVEW